MENPLHILLADDDKDDQYFFARALKKIPIATVLTTVDDGEDLMAFLHNNYNHLPDVIFSDLNMPRKKGSACLVEIKADERLKQIPVIIYSTAVHDETTDKLFENGAHYYMQKCDVPELPKVIYKALTLLSQKKSKPARNSFILNNIV